MSNIQKSNVNAIKVTYNPYVKQFSYGVWNTEKRQFDELKVGNDLHDKDYYKSSSLHVKAFDIVNKINKMYNKNDRQHSILKTDILFSGTKEDEEYFRQVTEKYFHHVTPKLNVVPADTGFYSSNKVKEKIDCIFKNT